MDYAASLVILVSAVLVPLRTDRHTQSLTETDADKPRLSWPFRGCDQGHNFGLKSGVPIQKEAPLGPETSGEENVEEVMRSGRAS